MNIRLTLVLIAAALNNVYQVYSVAVTVPKRGRPVLETHIPELGANEATMTAGSVFTSHHPTPAADLLSREVAFSVQKVTNTFHAVTRVHFRDVLTNIGGCWDPITSEFVAPYNGGYYFIFHVLGARHSDFTMTLMKNGVYQVTAYGTEKTFETASNSAFLELRRLDKIWLMLQQGSIDEHPGNETYNTFAGFLMFPL